jgi:ribosomal protein L10
MKIFPAFRSLKILIKEGAQIEILKGYFEGKVLSKEEVLEIINLPSKEELILKILQNLKSQVYRLTYALEFPLKKLTFVLSQIKK